jgi:hypothetical protein
MVMPTLSSMKNLAMPKKNIVSIGSFGAGYIFNAKADALMAKIPLLNKLPLLAPSTWTSIGIIFAGAAIRKAYVATFGLGGLVRDIKDQYLTK